MQALAPLAAGLGIAIFFLAGLGITIFFLGGGGGASEEAVALVAAIVWFELVGTETGADVALTAVAGNV